VDPILASDTVAGVAQMGTPRGDRAHIGCLSQDTRRTAVYTQWHPLESPHVLLVTQGSHDTRISGVRFPALRIQNNPNSLGSQVTDMYPGQRTPSPSAWLWWWSLHYQVPRTLKCKSHTLVKQSSTQPQCAMGDRRWKGPKSFNNTVKTTATRG
jgi:hypothetical protein